MITRREFVLVSAAAPLVSFAQTTKVWRIGFLASTAPANTPQFKAFSEGLAALGYVEGKILKFDIRWPQRPSDRLADLAKDLAQVGIDLIFAWGTPAALAAKQSTSLIPVVFAGVADPVGSALVESLNYPGANVTGVTNLSRGLIAKLVELLTQIAPRIKRVAALRNPANPVSALQLSEAQGAANTLGLQLTAIDLNGLNDLADTFAKMRKARVEGVVVLSDPQLFGERQKIALLAREARILSISTPRGFAEAGGLMSYGEDGVLSYRRVANLADRIFKGAKPADLPVEQPSWFDLVLNMKTANSLGIKVPQSILVQATKVIE